MPDQNQLPVDPSKLAAFASQVTPSMAPGPMSLGQPAQAPQAAADPVSILMAKAQQALQNQNAQMVPPAQAPLINSQIHPVVAGILNALATGASSYGQVAMSPQERLARQENEQQKAQTLAQLAANQQYREGELGYRQQMAQAAEENAETRKAGEQSEAENRKFMQQIQQSKLDLAQAQNEWKKDLAAGRLSVAQKSLDQRASQFEQNFKLAGQKLGIEQAKLQLMDQATAIKQGMLDLAQTALAQKGTIEGTQAIENLQKIELEHPILSNFFGLDDIAGAVKQTQQAPIPGTAAPLATAPAQRPSAAPQAAPAKPAKSGGVTHVWTPNGIQPIGNQ